MPEAIGDGVEVMDEVLDLVELVDLAELDDAFEVDDDLTDEDEDDSFGDELVANVLLELLVNDPVVVLVTCG